MYKIMDLFCGTGGFSKGFSNFGAFDVVHGVDVLPIAIDTFSANHPGAHSVVGDIRKVRRSEVAAATGLAQGDVDVIVGGPPCQGFSSIRPFRSSKEDDPRNSLFEEFASYVNYFRPKVFVMENVVGLATHAGGRTLTQILETFSQLKYECDWRILNAANYGVPQKRERLILVGVQEGGKFNFPSFTHLAEQKTIGHKDRARMHVPNAQPTLLDLLPQSLEPAVTVREAISDLPPIQSGETAERYEVAPKNEYQSARRRRTNETLTLHQSTKHSAKMLEIIRHAGDNISCIPEHLISSGFSSSYSRLSGDQPSVTITVNFVHPASNKCIHPDLDRALTPREGARLQSFDDDFEFRGNRAQVVKQIGNAVPPLLGYALAASVSQCIG